MVLPSGEKATDQIDLAESHDQWRGEPGSGSITAELLPLPNMNAPQQ